MAVMGSSVIWPTKLPRCPASLIQGPMTRASSADTEGMLRALATAPVRRKSAICSATWRATFSWVSVGGGAQVRGDDDVGQVEQGAVGGGLLGEHVEGGAGHAAVLESLGQGVLVHEAAAGAVDDAHAGLEALDRLARQDVAGLVGERDVEGDEVGTGEERIELDLLDAHLVGLLLPEEGVIGDDLHPEPPARGRRRWSRCCPRRSRPGSWPSAPPP